MEKIYKFIIIILLILQIVVCVYFTHLKQTCTCDGVFSYGLANSEEYTFLDPVYDRWVSADYFKNYVISTPDKLLDFQQVYQNQINDVHPPLYYY